MTRTPKTAAVNLRVDEDVRKRAVELANDAGMSLTDYVVELLKIPLNTRQKFEITQLTMDSPSYFMTNDFDLTDVNRAASTLFDIRLVSLPLKFKEFWDKIKSSVKNADKVAQNMRDNFLDRKPHECPPVDVEEIELDTSRFGAVKLKKVGIYVATVGSSGWVVTFNIISIEKREEFDAELLNQIEPLVLRRL